ncbi:type VII secretion protein EccCb [Mycobacterium sp. 4D054]|uniref:type VII secretion protein EccCb n=1 Tax=Mycobacterium sp. 4D054 TaxID=3457440 RepID=UPI003FD03198
MERAAALVRLLHMDLGRIVLDKPPEPPAQTPMSPLARLMPVAMIVAMAGMTVLYLTSAGSTRNPMFLFFPVMMLVSLIGTLAHTGRDRTGDLDTGRAGYLRYLGTVDDALVAAGDTQYRSQHDLHPEPAALWTIAGGERMFRRAADGPDFGVVRIGVGEQPAAVSVVAPDLGPDDEADPVTAGAVRRLVRHHAMVADLPVVVRLASAGLITVDGDPADVRAVVRAMVCQLAVHHDPGLMTVAAAGPQLHWDWMKWLPHAGERRRGRRHLLIVDGGAAPQPADGVTVVALRPGPGTGVAVHVDGQRVDARFDELALPAALACARRLSRHRPHESARADGVPDWAALMGIADPQAVDAEARWSRRSPAGLLPVPVGVADDGTVVDLDINEAAAGGLGPHGLCVGATGSGKSEFLRTLVLGMVTAHPPEALNLVLVDFKGGATFLGLDGVRHVSAVITNLADEAPLVARMRDALSGEINRRQEILRAAGNLTNLTEYGRARVLDRTLPPLPALLIIVDEFSELLSRHPDFAELFVAIGRLGRSLGMHLLLASQRLDEGRLRGLETHLSYRICLKTFSAAESRSVLGVPDAHQLPARPGAAYLSTAAGTLTRFQTAFVSGCFPVRRQRRDSAPEVRRFTLIDRAGGAAPAPSMSRLPLLETVLGQLAGRGAVAHRVWLPPLGRSPRLDAVLSAATAGRLRVPIGVVDRTFEQRRDPLIVDLSSGAGHVAVVGAPRSGKSTALRTIIGALAATHDAGAVQFYCLDFGGGDLAAVRDLPHVGAVAGRSDSDLCRRIVAQLEAVLRSREAAGGVREDPYGEVVLVVDGWVTLRQDFDGMDSAITAMAAQGLAYGVHVMVTASRWADLRPALKDQIGTRIELRLGDPADSELDRRRAKELAARPPGRGITADGCEMVIATPDVEPMRDGGAAPPVELLPARVDRSAIDVPGRRRGQVLLGLGERDLNPVTMDLGEHPHLLVLGDGECGKTALLRLLCTELAAAADEPHLEIVDFRRTLLGVVESGPRVGYAVSGVAATSRTAALTERLNARMPDEFVTQQQLRDRSWWSGPDIYVIVDDYDLVAGATGNPLAPLADFLPHAKDLGLHVIVARRSGGAARAMFDPVLARMRDMGCAGVMMSASPDEGVLLGATRPTPLPPGRATLSVRGRPDELVQTAWVEPP